MSQQTIQNCLQPNVKTYNRQHKQVRVKIQSIAWTLALSQPGVVWTDVSAAVVKAITDAMCITCRMTGTVGQRQLCHRPRRLKWVTTLLDTLCGEMG